MLEMPIRTGRRIQDAVRQVREGISRHTNERQQVNSLHRQRMTCSDGLRGFSNTQDWMNGMSMSPSGRFRIPEQAKAKRKVFSREGISWGAAWALLAAVIAICLIILTVDFAGMGMNSRNIGRLNKKIEDMDRRNAAMRQEIEVNAGDVSVCTEAVKLNMISGYGAQTVVLTVPQGYNVNAAAGDVRGAAEWTTGDANP